MWIEWFKIVLCIYFSSQLVLSYSYQYKNDHIKNGRYIPNKYTFLDGNVKLRHSSRFPNLDKVKTRLESLSVDSERNAFHPYKLRHHGWNAYRTTTTTTTTTEDGLFETYGDLDALEEENKDFNDDDKSEYDDDVNYDDEVTNDPLFDNAGDSRDDDMDVQAEEATERQVPSPKILSGLTEYKWKNFGTRKAVDQAMQNHLNLNPSSEERRTAAVIEHFHRVKKDSRCGRPLPKVIPVQSVHPNPSMKYTPHCTVLHRCAEDTGCCNDGSSCQYKTRNEVHLYFYAKPLGSSSTKIEKLTFFNHTECECKSKNRNTTVENYTLGSSDVESSSLGPGIRYKSASTFGRAPENIQRCNCPKEFTPRYRYNMKCLCDCEEDNQDCLRMKRGKEHFGLEDRRCIKNGQCGTPVCEHGKFFKDCGRCPRKSEKYEDCRRFSID